MNKKQTITKSRQINWFKQRWNDIVGNATYEALKWIVRVSLPSVILVIIGWLQYWLGFLSDSFVITGRLIFLAALLVLGLTIIQHLVFIRKRRSTEREYEQIIREMLAEQDQRFAGLTEQLIKKEQLIEQCVKDKKTLILNRNSLMLKHGLDIISAKYGLEIKATEDVTEKIVSELTEKGEIFVDNDLVGGNENDPVKHTRKNLYVSYIQGKVLSKSVREREILSIKDLVQDFADTRSEKNYHYSGRQKSRWKIE